MSDTRCYLNGTFLPLSEARISPLDRGFLFADGAYEVMPVYSRHAFRREEHLRRLQDSLDGIRLPNPLSLAEWCAVIDQVISAAPFDDQSLYLQITRGADSKRDQPFPKGVAPTVFVFTAPLTQPTPQQRETGVAAITVPDIRWGRCDLKTIALLPNILARQQAVDARCTEAILIRNDHLIEGSASNIFIVRDGIILAPPKDHQMLPGTTYDLVLELAARHGARHQVRPITETELRTADEVWMTSSTKEVLAITTLDQAPVGHGPDAGRPGPVGKQMQAWYVDFREHYMRHGRG